MPCSVCLNILYLWKDGLNYKCPNCEAFEVLSKGESLRIVGGQISQIQGMMDTFLLKYSRDSILLKLIAVREKELLDSFKEKPIISLVKLLATTSLIKRIVLSDLTFGHSEISDNEITRFTDTYSDFVDILEKEGKITEDLGRFVSIPGNPSPYFSYNEDWIPIIKTYNRNEVVDKKAAEAFFEKHKDEYTAAGTPTARSTPKEKISSLYTIMEKFNAALSRNPLFQSTFDTKSYLENRISPELILKLSSVCPIGSVYTTSTSDFRKRIKRFTRNQMVTYDAIVLGKSNPVPIPLFISYGGNIYFTPASIYLIVMLNYYIEYYKNEFNSEKQKRADMFEKNIVPSKFIECGFKVSPDFTDKKKSSLQIDCLAWKPDVVYVVECKVWNFDRFLEYERTRVRRIRDLEGVVDGIEYTTKEPSGERIKPSLLKKIDHVKMKLGSIIPDVGTSTKVLGVVISNQYPPICEYKSVKLKSIDEISEL